MRLKTHRFNVIKVFKALKVSFSSTTVHTSIKNHDSNSYTLQWIDLLSRVIDIYKKMNINSIEKFAVTKNVRIFHFPKF